MFATALNDFVRDAGILYFRGEELLSRTKRRGPKVITPPRHLWANIIPTLHAADLIRSKLKLPIKVNSAYRTPAYNEMLGNGADSQHVAFRALDMTCDDLPALIEVTLETLNALAARGTSTGVGVYPTFVHIDVGAPGKKIRRW